MEIPKDIREILHVLSSKGFQAFIVGGCVRDYVMDIEPNDFDITTSARPEEITSIFPKNIPTGIKHGTVTVFIGRSSAEVTTFRTDSEYSDHRRPDTVNFSLSLKDDLSRRDFTMNALAYSESTGIVDYFNGLEHIKRRVIVCVGEPDKRFKEDSLRMMRAVRFSAQLNFDIDSEVIESIKRNSSLIKYVSAERIRDEFTRTLNSNFPDKISLYRELGLMKYFLPVISTIENDKYNYILNVIKKLSINNCPKILRLAALFLFSNANEAKSSLKNLRFDNKSINSVIKIIDNLNLTDNPSSTYIRIYASELGADTLRNILYLKNAISEASHEYSLKNFCSEALKNLDLILEKGDCISLSHLNVSGNDLAEIGIEDGKEKGAILKQLLQMTLNEPYINNKETLIYIAKEIHSFF